MSFFEFIRIYFGYQICSILKTFIKLMKTNAKLRVRIYFLKTCINNDLIPVHLYKLSHFDVNNPHTSSSRKVDKLKYNFVHKLLRIELQDAYKQLSHLKHKLFTNCRSIHCSLLDCGSLCKCIFL